jgi:arylsulfatase/uncharacterized sulfatase
MRWCTLYRAAVGLLAMWALAATAEPAFASRPPNVLLVLADDLGFTDLASYGSEISTPHIDSLAQQGTRFSNYHSAANCAPARAMLLTGVNAHRAGVPNIPEMLPSEQMRHANYQGVLGDNVVTLATLLESAGYHTYMAGKWHLGTGPGKLPSERGFERTVALADSGADNWEQRPYLTLYDEANWYADGREYTLPEDFYSSRFLVDQMIEFIDTNIEDGRPFFAYLPFQAVHMPVQAPQEFIDRYMGVYDDGWDALRERRQARAAELGIIPAVDEMVRMPTTLDWAALDPAQQAYEAKRMAVYAAMLEAMDHHLGRLLNYLRASGEYNNTVVIFTSDNGAESSGPDRQNSFITRRGVARLGYTTDYDTLGLRGSFNSISPSFASAVVAPLSYYKFYAGEGGMRVPLIIAGAGIPGGGQLNHAFSFVTDIAPTILSFAGVDVPGERFAGRPVEAMTGRDLGPLLLQQVERIHGPDDAIGYELAGHSALFQGDYKVVRIDGPLGDGEWHLYDILRDPGETQDLADVEPHRLQRMLSAYQRYARDNGVLPTPVGYGTVKQVAINTLHKRLREPLLVLMLALLVTLPIYVLYRMRGHSE